MSNIHSNAEHAHHDSGTKEIWRTFWILLVLTIVELVFGYILIGKEPGVLVHTLKGFIIILMLAKAFYIIAYFMHLKHEVKGFVMTLVVPCLLFIWFITAFLIDGNSFKNLRNTYDPYHKERSEMKMDVKEHGEETHKPDAQKEGKMD